MRRATLHLVGTLALCLGLLASPALADAPAPGPQPETPAVPAPAPPPKPEPESEPAAPAVTDHVPLVSPGPLPPPSTEDPSPPAMGPHEGSDTWLDTSHTALSRGFFWTVKRFDRFFSDERQVDLPRAESFVRWRSELRIRDDGSLAANTSLQIAFRLPAFNERLDRLRLTLIANTVSPPDPLFPTRYQADAPDRANAGLLVALHDSIGITVDAQTGLLFHLPVGWFARVRARQAFPLGWNLVGRDAVSLFWQTNTGFGTRQDVSLERVLVRELMVRLDGTGTVTERSRGWEWEANVSLLAALGPRTAAAISFGVLSATDLGAVVERHRVLARIRHAVLRRWILLELQPEIEWLRLPEGHVERARAVIVRLEVQFDASTLITGSDTWPVVW